MVERPQSTAGLSSSQSKTAPRSGAELRDRFVSVIASLIPAIRERADDPRLGLAGLWHYLYEATELAKLFRAGCALPATEWLTMSAHRREMIVTLQMARPRGMGQSFVLFRATCTFNPPVRIEREDVMVHVRWNPLGDGLPDPFDLFDARERGWVSTPMGLPSLLPYPVLVSKSNLRRNKFTKIDLIDIAGCLCEWQAMVGGMRPEDILDEGSHPDGPEEPIFFWRRGKRIELQPIPWRLLNYLWFKRSAPLDELYGMVWGEYGEMATDGALKSAMTRVNRCDLGFQICRKAGVVYIAPD